MLSKVITIAQQKGGTGKTSWVVKYLFKYLLSVNPDEDMLFLTPTHAAKNRGINELSELLFVTLFLNLINSNFKTFEKISFLRYKDAQNSFSFIILNVDSFFLAKSFISSIV